MQGIRRALAKTCSRGVHSPGLGPWTHSREVCPTSHGSPKATFQKATSEFMQPAGKLIELFFTLCATDVRGTDQNIGGMLPSATSCQTLPTTHGWAFRRDLKKSGGKESYSHVGSGDQKFASCPLDIHSSPTRPSSLDQNTHLSSFSQLWASRGVHLSPSLRGTILIDPSQSWRPKLFVGGGCR